jgi:hypothetical protein
MESLLFLNQSSRCINMLIECVETRRENVRRTGGYKTCRTHSVYNAFLMKYKIISSKINVFVVLSPLFLHFIVKNIKNVSTSHSFSISSKVFLRLGVILVSNLFRRSCISRSNKMVYLFQCLSILFCAACISSYLLIFSS